MKKSLCMVVVLCIWGTSLFAQTEINLPPVEYPLIDKYLKISPAPKKQPPIFSLDIPISPFWDTVHGDRVKNHTIQFGGLATPWKNTVMFGGWPVPRITFATADFRTTLEGGVMKTLNDNFARTMRQANVVFEGGIWYVLVGAEGFFGREEIPQITNGVNFDADFKRRSFGGQGWVGVKVGDFNQSFIVGRYGMGYARTEGSNHFSVPNISNFDWFPVYLEEFRTTSISVEGKTRAKRISQSVKFDRTEYERMTLSPDPLRFGENRLEDIWLRAETEVIPFSKIRFLRGVVVLTKDFKNQNRLMFINDYSSVRVLLRLAL